MRKVQTLVGCFYENLLAALREIFDETAYSRFLQRTNAVQSAKSYAAFSKEIEEIKMRRPKCC